MLAIIAKFLSACEATNPAVFSVGRGWLVHKHLLHLEMNIQFTQVYYTYIPGKCIVPSTAVALVVSLFHTRAMLEGQRSTPCKTKEATVES